MQLLGSQSRGPLWRKLLVALMVVIVAVPMFALPADAASADKLTVRFNSPAPNAKVNGFLNVGFTVNPRGQLGVPRRREDSTYRAYSMSYAPGANVTDDGSFQVWRIDGGVLKDAPGAIGLRNNRSVYVQPGIGSIRPPRAGGFPWDTTLVPDGPATLRIRGFGYDGSFKDAYLTVQVENKGVSPDYVEYVSPKNGDTVKGWVPVVFTAMPQYEGINYGKRYVRYTNYLPNCLDTDLFYGKVEYAPGTNPGDTDWILWWYNSFSGQTRIKEQIPQDGKVQLSFTGCDSMYVLNGGPQWDSTLVADGPATIRVTVVFTDGSYRAMDRVVNVANQGAGVTYFGIDRSAITGPIKGDNWGVPGWANVPFKGVPRWTYELPMAYWACDVAAGDVTANPMEGEWTMFWANDNLTWNETRTENGWVTGGETRLPDWSGPISYGRSGGLCRLDTTAVPNGVYSVRLRMQLTNGTTLADVVKVTVAN